MVSIFQVFTEVGVQTDGQGVHGLSVLVLTVVSYQVPVAVLGYKALRDLLHILAVDWNRDQGTSRLDVLNSVLIRSDLDGIPSAHHRVPVVVWTHITLD